MMIKTPYTFTINTILGPARLDFPATEYDEPAIVTASGPPAALQALRLHVQQYPCGFKGYPIESLDFCAPLDLHANLLTNAAVHHDPLLVGFEVVGYVPADLSAETADVTDEDALDDDDEEVA